MIGSSFVVVVAVFNIKLELALVVLALMPVLILVVDRDTVVASLVFWFFALRTMMTDVITPRTTRKTSKERTTKNQHFWRYQGTAAFRAVSSGIW
jgi:hypothetical protein